MPLTVTCKCGQKVSSPETEGNPDFACPSCGATIQSLPAKTGVRMVRSLTYEKEVVAPSSGRRRTVYLFCAGVASAAALIFETVRYLGLGASATGWIRSIAVILGVGAIVICMFVGGTRKRRTV